MLTNIAVQLTHKQNLPKPTRNSGSKAIDTNKPKYSYYQLGNGLWALPTLLLEQMQHMLRSTQANTIECGLQEFYL